jgi:hypothetical protein
MTRNYHPTISNATINLINSLPEYTIVNGKPVRQFIYIQKSVSKKKKKNIHTFRIIFYQILPFSSDDHQLFNNKINTFLSV